MMPTLPSAWTDSEKHSARTLFDRLRMVDLSFVLEKLVFDGRIDTADAAELEEEFKKYMALVATREEPMAVVGPLVDEVWHQFVLFTEEYERFCRKQLGFFAHHRPDTKATPVPLAAGENFLGAYESEFGPIPSLWWKGLGADAIAHYSVRPVSGPPAQGWSGWTGRRFPIVSTD